MWRRCWSSRRWCPAGTAVAYGDVAELLGAGGPRQVGSVMSHHGSAVPWWRILKANGDAPPGHEREALAFYLAEGTPLLGSYLDYRAHRRGPLAGGPGGGPVGARPSRTSSGSTPSPSASSGSCINCLSPMMKCLCE